jgi:hypothetical protein
VYFSSLSCFSLSLAVGACDEKESLGDTKIEIEDWSVLQLHNHKSTTTPPPQPPIQSVLSPQTEMND